MLILRNFGPPVPDAALLLSGYSHIKFGAGNMLPLRIIILGSLCVYFLLF